MDDSAELGEVVEATPSQLPLDGLPLLARALRREAVGNLIENLLNRNFV
jgi:hypothetical protein